MPNVLFSHLLILQGLAMILLGEFEAEVLFFFLCASRVSVSLCIVCLFIAVRTAFILIHHSKSDSVLGLCHGVVGDRAIGRSEVIEDLISFLSLQVFLILIFLFIELAPT